MACRSSVFQESINLLINQIISNASPLWCSSLSHSHILSPDTKFKSKTMPSIYSKNISTHEAQQRSQSGQSREQQSFRTNNESHPSSGGSHGYPLWLRRDIMFWDNLYGIDYVVNRFTVSKATIYRWRIRTAPYQQTGCHERQILTGHDQLLLVMVLFIFPRATNDEIATFIAVNGGTGGLSRQAISSRLEDLDVSRKRASLEAFAAYTPTNMMRAELFFSEPMPVGINGIPFFRLIDIDEAKFCLSGIESKYGRSLTCVRVRDTAHYKRMSRGITLILAVEPGNPHLPAHIYGSIQNPRKWWQLTVDNVNQVVFADFVDVICTDIEQNPIPGNYDNERVLMWDNLSAHATGLVQQTVELRPTRPEQKFTIVPRPPYRPMFAPVEYMFCEVASRLSRMVKKNWTIVDLRCGIVDCLIDIGRNCKLNRTFRHCLDQKRH